MSKAIPAGWSPVQRTLRPEPAGRGPSRPKPAARPGYSRPWLPPPPPPSEDDE